MPALSINYIYYKQIAQIAKNLLKVFLCIKDRNNF